MITFEFQINHPGSSVENALEGAKLECRAGEVSKEQKVKGQSVK